MTMQSHGNFGPLIGVIYVNGTHCHFYIYSTKNAEVLTFHELALKQIVHNAGWLEYDPIEIWKNTSECIEVAYKNLEILKINPHDIIAISICNIRGTIVIWDKETGQTLYNAISWSDCRCIPQLEAILNKVKHNVNYLRPKSGLPLSTCFSALKIQWLIENVAKTQELIDSTKLCVGTLDSWILWNITGAEVCGVHATDVTNAQYTGLMNINTLQWDKFLCNFFHIPLNILPCIRSNSEVFGYVIGGPLNGKPIGCCIGDQPSTFLGQLALKSGQNICFVDDSCFVLLNTGDELIESENGLLSIVGFKLGDSSRPCYALEGAIGNAGSTVKWLKDTLRINPKINDNDNMVEALSHFLSDNSMMSSCSSSMLNAECGRAAKRSDVIFIPAFHGLYSPYWRYDARGLLLGLNSQTTSENITQAAFEATGFQIHEILEAFKRDTFRWNWRNRRERLILCGGDYLDNTSFIQCIADIVGFVLEKPQTTVPAGLGAMIAAGITMQVLDLKHAELAYIPPSDAFSPSTTPNRRNLLYKRWEYAVSKCLNWNNYATYEADLALFAQRERDPNITIRRSLPGSIFLTSAFTLLIVAKFLQNSNIT